MLLLVIVSGVLYSYPSSIWFNWKGVSVQTKEMAVLLEAHDLGGLSGGHFWLCQNAEVQELQRLIDYPNPVIRATAYAGLMKQDSINVYHWALSALGDSEICAVEPKRYGCSSYAGYNPSWFLGEFMLNLSEKDHETSWRVDNMITCEQREILKEIYQRNT